MNHKTLEKKVVAVIAEPSPIAIMDTTRQVMAEGKADILKLRLDCLDPQYLNEQTITQLKRGLAPYSLMVSIRNVRSVPEQNREQEGFRSGKHDLDRIALLRKAVEEGVQYFELEHELRRNFFLLGQTPTQVVILYSNLHGTPDFPKLKEIYADVIRQGADQVIFETLVRDKGKDQGAEDKANLIALADAVPSIERYRPLTIVGRGKYGRDLNLELYNADKSSFVYGVVPSFNPLPFLTKKRTYQEMPTLDEVNRRIKK